MKLFYSVFLVLMFFFAKSQDLSHINYTNNNGLPSNEVFGMAIDKKGYLWACTDKGISKFDGSSFTNITSLKGLNDNVFFNITHDYKDRIWLWSYNQKYNYILDGKIYDYKYNSLIRKIAENEYQGASIGIGKNDKLFFSLNGKNFSISNKGIVNYYDNIIFGQEYIITIKNNQFKNEGIKTIDLNCIKNNYWFKKAPKGSIFNLYTNNKTHYFTRLNEILVLNQNQVKIKVFDDNIESLCVDNKNRIWISFMLKNLKLFETIDGPPKVIFTKSSGKVIKDQNGNIWFSDSYKGLFKFQNSFAETYEIDEADVLSILLPTKKSIFINSYNNLFYKYNFSTKKVEKAYDYPIHDALPFVDDITFNNDKIEFYGTFHSGFIYKKDTINSIKTIQKTNNHFVFSSSDCFYILNPSKGICKKHTTTVGKIKDLFYKDNKTIFLATINGIYIYNGLNQTITKIKDNLYANEHTQVIKKVGNYLLFGTKGKGVAVYSLGDKKITSYYHQENSEMPNSINSIYSKEEKVYFGSNQGIFIYTFQNGLLKFETILNKNNGLSSNDILGIHTQDGILFSITENKLNRINLNNSDIFVRPVPNVPDILSIKVNDRLSSNLNSIATDYDKNDIEIQFNSPYLLDKTRITYFYKLNNFDSKWYTTATNQIQFNNLPPGSYNLELYAALDKGKIKSKIKSLKIVVSQPFWMSLTFRIIIIILFLTLLFGLISFYFYLKSQQSKKKMQMIEYQQQALRAQIKPHFIFNALNSIQNFVLKNKVNNALDFIEKFSNLTRSILDTSENEYTTLTDELITTKHYLDIEKIRFSNFDYAIKISKDIDTDSLLVPSLLLQPIVENAVWHGLQEKSETDLGKIQIDIAIEDENLILVIEDNGVGRKASKKTANHKSKGLSMLKKRLDLLQLKNVSFEFVDLYKNDKATGTKVIIKLSLNHKKT